MRRLLRCKGDHAILEGPHLVSEAVTLGIELGDILASPEFMAHADGRRIERLLPRRPLMVDRRILDSLADSDSPRGLLAVATLPRQGVDGLPAVENGVIVLAEGVQDPGNLGALARSIEAAGGAGLALTSECAHPNHPRALRASAGSLLRLPVAVGVNLTRLRSHLAPVAPTTLALEAHGGRDLYRDDWPGSLILLVGAEGPGLTPETLSAADHRVTIPLHGSVESLNASVAAAVVLFELRRRRAASR